MASHRKHKKDAAAVGLSERELRMAELLQEVIDALRWQQILSYTNQYLLNQRLKVDKDERDKILEAATRTVDKDAKLHEWQERLAQIKGEIVEIKRGINRAKKDMARSERTDRAAE